MRIRALRVVSIALVNSFAETCVIVCTRLVNMVESLGMGCVEVGRTRRCIYTLN